MALRPREASLPSRPARPSSRLSLLNPLRSWLPARRVLAAKFMPPWAVWAYYGFGVLLLSKAIPVQRRRWAAAALAPALGVALFFSNGLSNHVDLTVLSVNDGTSIFLDAPGARNDMLIDGGGGWSGSHTLIPFLRAHGVNRLAAIVLTCGDKAHAAGLNVVANEIPAQAAIYSGIAAEPRHPGPPPAHRR